MHKIYYGVAFIFILSNIAISKQAPVENLQKSVYDVLVEYSRSKCPYLKTTKLLEAKPTFLDSCSNYTTVKSVSVLEIDTQRDVTCLFYYNNFILLCDNITRINVTKFINNGTIDIALKLYNLNSVCNELYGMQFIPDLKNAESLLNDFKKPNVCNKICSDLVNDNVIPLCSLAAYNLNITKNLKSLTENTIATKQVPKTIWEKQVHPYPVKDQNVNANPNLKPLLIEKSKEIEPISSTKEESQNPPLVKSIFQPDKNSNFSIHQPDQQSQPQSKREHLEENPEVKEDGSTGMELETVKPDDDKTTLDNIVKPDIGESPQNDNKQDLGTPQDDNKQDLGASQDDNNKQDLGAPLKAANEKSKEESTSSVGHEEAPETKTNNENNLEKTDPSQLDKTDVNPPSNAVQDNTGDMEFEDESNEHREFESQANENLNIDDLGEEGEVPPQEPPKLPDNKIKANTKPQETDEDNLASAYNNPNSDEEDSFFFIYFMMVCAVFILGYIGYHNKQKVLALVIEGRRGRRGSRRGRPNSANYHKLDSNLEEAVTSSCNKNTTNIIY